MCASSFEIEAITPSVSVARILADLHATCFADSPQEPWSSNAIATLLKAPGTIGLVAVGYDGAAAGFAIARKIADEGEVLTLCVSPLARRQGLATALLGAVSEALMPCRRVLLEVATTNQAARTLYERLGFYEVGHRPAYYRRGGKAVDALVLSNGEP